MAVQIIEDIFEDISADVTGDGVDNIPRTVLITNLDEVATPPARLAKALYNYAPKRGDRHPRFVWAYADTIAGEMLDPSTCRVRVIYRPLHLIARSHDESDLAVGAPPTLTVGSTVQTVQTRKDIFGNPLKIIYVTEETTDTPSKTLEQIVTASVQVSMPTFTYSRMERGSPRDKARRFVGKVNATGIFDGDPPRTWMCTAISGETAEMGVGASQSQEFLYNVRYEFQRSEPNETWDTSRLFYYEGADGKTPANIQIPTFNIQSGQASGPSNGVLIGVQLLEAIEFRELDLTW